LETQEFDPGVRRDLPLIPVMKSISGRQIGRAEMTPSKAKFHTKSLEIPNIHTRSLCRSRREEIAD
jgi:hypothetical protein